MSVPFIVLDGVGFLNTSHLICTTLLVIIPSYLDVLSAPTQTKLALVCYWLCTHLSCFSYVTLYRQSKYTVFTNALLQAFAPYCRVAIVRVKSTLAAKDDPLGNGEPTVMFLETSKMCVAHILPTPAGCVEARPGPPSHAPSKM